MLKFALFAGLFILLIATSGCLEGPAGPPGESSVDTVYVVDTGGVSGFMYDTVFVCPTFDTTISSDTLVYLKLPSVPHSWHIIKKGIMDPTLMQRDTTYFQGSSVYNSRTGFEFSCSVSPYAVTLSHHVFYNL